MLSSRNIVPPLLILFVKSRYFSLDFLYSYKYLDDPEATEVITRYQDSMLRMIYQIHLPQLQIHYFLFLELN